MLPTLKPKWYYTKQVQLMAQMFLLCWSQRLNQLSFNLIQIHRWQQQASGFFWISHRNSMLRQSRWTAPWIALQFASKWILSFPRKLPTAGMPSLPHLASPHCRWPWASPCPRSFVSSASQFRRTGLVVGCQVLRGIILRSEIGKNLASWPAKKLKPSLVARKNVQLPPNLGHPVGICIDGYIEGF